MSDISDEKNVLEANPEEEDESTDIVATTLIM